MIKIDMLTTAALAAFWAASSEFNSALQIPTNTQNLEDITGAIGGIDHDKELDELLQGLDVLTSMGGDAISSIVAALVGTGLYAGYKYYGNGTHDEAGSIIQSIQSINNRSINQQK